VVVAWPERCAFGESATYRVLTDRSVAERFEV